MILLTKTKKLIRTQAKPWVLLIQDMYSHNRHLTCPVNLTDGHTQYYYHTPFTINSYLAKEIKQ